MTSLAERELLAFWRASSAVNVLRRVPGKAGPLADAVAELEVIVLHTRWNRLRAAAAAMLAIAVPAEAMAAVAAVLEAVC